MIGSGIFIVSAGMARQLGSPGWLLVAWIITGALTITAALSYGELAAMMPKAGGQYVYLRTAYNPMCGFLYGWTLFTVIQTGTIAAVSVAFARFAGVLFPWISESRYLIPPVHLSSGYALSLSTAQVVGIVLIAGLTWTNTWGLKYGKAIQNIFTTAKTGGLLALILVGVVIGWNTDAVRMNFGDLWGPRGFEPIVDGVSVLTAYGVFVALCVSQTGSLFSADAWNNITFTAGEVKDPRRNIPLSLAFGTIIVISLYVLANVAYLVTLPFDSIQHAPADRVGTATIEAIVPGLGGSIMALAIMLSTFGCNNGLILAGARAYYAMARDKLFLTGRANSTTRPPRAAGRCAAAGRRGPCPARPGRRPAAPSGLPPAGRAVPGRRRAAGRRMRWGVSGTTAKRTTALHAKAMPRVRYSSGRAGTVACTNRETK